MIENRPLVNGKIRVLIVDDEPLALRALRAMLSADAEVEIIAECDDGRQAITIIRDRSPNIVFLDVQMSGMNGFDVVREIGIENMPLTIFVTAYDKYAVQAFEARALDYLLKPFDHERFEEALNRAKNSFRQQKLGKMNENLLTVLKDMNVSPSKLSPPLGEKINALSPAEPLERLVIKSGGRIYFLKTEEIDWIAATGDYVELHAGNKTHLMREMIGNLQPRLDSKKFLRIHRSIIVNIERIKEIQPLFKGEYIITLSSGIQLKSSRGYRSELLELFGNAR
ncbi:MAG TPA: LytTR family DNA-binding domain-containing protein [Pyrinomonadaceae bacterium]|nr:LytTR family DNA-binding domain-containing protein [Pyrinomonadaceae bacterium]